MDILQGVDVLKLGATGFMAFGAVFIVSMYKTNMDAKTKTILHFVLFLAFSFIPVEIANIIAQKIRDAIAGTLLVVGFYQAGKGITKQQPIQPNL